jgi:hypothetical protein
MSVLDQVVLVVVGWLADHSPPMLAGFIGGLVSSWARERWKRHT